MKIPMPNQLPKIALSLVLTPLTLAKGAWKCSMAMFKRKIKGDKFDTAEVAERLTICSTCEWHDDGMCDACGCFLELKATVKDEVCPLDKWPKESE